MSQPATKSPALASIPLSPLQQVLAGRAAASPPSGTLTRPPNPSTSSPSQLQPQLQSPSRRADITHNGGETVSELDTELRKSSTNFRNSLVEIAHYAFRLRETLEDWSEVNAASEEEYFTRLGHSAATWDSFLLLGERLAGSGLSLAQMRQITASAARLLTSISAKLWPEFAWVDEARLLPPADFALLVRERRASSSRRGLAEPKSSLSLPVPLLERDRLERRIHALRRREHLLTPAETLDFALRAAESAPAVTSAVLLLDRAAEELAEVWDQPLTQDLEAQLAARECARKLTYQIQRALKELRQLGGSPRATPSVSSQVAQEGVPATGGNSSKI